MADKDRPRRPVADRARRRAVREQAAQTGVPYSEAARQLSAARLASGEMLASHGRTVYPEGADSHRLWLIESRDRRTFPERVKDTRRAAEIPAGRARHLTERFPQTRGEAGTGVGLLYHGAGREDVLALLYLVVAREAPGLVPTAGDLAWIAELGEETAVDIACADLDRAARLMLDEDRPRLWPRIEAALTAGSGDRNWPREEVTRLGNAYRAAMTPYDGADGEPSVAGPPLDGVRHILDAVLVVADDGHAPGTRVRILASPHEDQPGTIVGACWGRSGPPIAYQVLPDGTPPVLVVNPDQLIVRAVDRAR